jgi:hypothetical protein
MKQASEKRKPSKRLPAVRLTDPRFKYSNAVETDVQKTWMRFGWVPPTPRRPL